MTRNGILPLLSCLMAFLGQAAMIPAAAPAADFSNVVIFATNSAKLGNSSDVLSGDIVVNGAATGLTLVPGFELSIGTSSTTPDTGAIVVADSVEIGKKAMVGGGILYNNIVNHGTINGSQTTPVTLPFFDVANDLPPFQTGTPGNTDVVVPRNQVRSLAGGDYRDIVVKNGGTLVLTGGVYNVRSIEVGNGASLAFDAPAEVRVANRVTTSKHALVGPTLASLISAADIVFFVNGVNGANGGAGRPRSLPAAVKIGESSVVDAVFWAPNGTLQIQNHTDAAGVFLARDVLIENHVQISLSGGSIFADVAPAITSVNATTFNVGQAGTFTVTTTGSPTPTITRGGVALPSGVNFVDNGNGTGTLSGTPGAGTSGTYAITFTATNAAGSSPTQNFTLTVIVVNGAPSFTKGPDQTVLEDAGAQTVANWATAISAGPPDDAGQTLTFIVTNNTNPGLFAAGPVVSSTGTLTYTPAANANGAATITLVLMDNGGTANGGVDTSAPQSFVINVTAVNDAPSFTKGSDQTVLEDAGAQTVLNWATAISSGPADESAQTLTFNITGNTNSGLFSAGPAISSTGTLTYTPNANANGTATITVTLSDDGGTANGGVNTSAPQTFVINITPVNDPPTANGFTNLPAQSSIPITYPAGKLGGTDPDGTAITIDTTPDSLCSGCLLTINTDGSFAFTPPPSAAGTTVSFTYHVNDNGTPLPSANSAPATVSFSVAGPAIYFVKSAAVGAGNCTLGNECTLATAVTNIGATTNARIFLGDANSYANAVPLNSGGWLIGQGVTGTTFDTLFGIVAPAEGTLATRPSLAGTRPTVQNTVTLNTNSAVRGLDISSTTNTGMTDPAGAITGVTVSEVSVTTTTGTAVNLSSTGGTLSFTSISANGGSNGISLNNTTGSFTVNGDGNTSVGGDSSGGTIQNTTSHGISLTNAQNVSLTNMNIHDNGHSGIDGQQVSNFAFKNGTINNVGTAAAGQYEESNIAFNDGGAFTTTSVSGTVLITDNILTNARRHGIQIENGSGTISNLTISGNTITSSTSAASSLGHGMLVLQQGSASTTSHLTTGTISGNTIANFPSGSGIFVGGGSGSSSNNTSATLGANGTPINITGNVIDGGVSKMGSNAIQMSFNGQVGVSNFNINNNGTVGSPLTNFQGQGISGFMGGTVTGTTTIDNNHIVANQTLGAGSKGIAVQVDDGPAGLGTSVADYNFIITNNTTSATEGEGIRVIARASLGKMDATIQDNTAAAPTLTNRNGIRIDSGSAAGDVTLCLTMSGNTSAGSGVNQGIGLRKQGTVATVNDFGIVGLSPSPTTGANAAARVATDNPAGGGVDIISGDNFVSCTVTP